ncbi:hypothetical protein QZM22_25780 [Burkholderia oklahomensis]|uniref:hypothetical protein n=1 Tax=Burkholderia oklahomensis TaxID=342113 RepID=UPI00265616F2|nr:hypothetical protein [Burkholderia oklahomensis]MDN7675815.1 hypothetical protein [Burkholderia oklahomensis]
MLVSRDAVDISPAALRTALSPARSLFHEEWLNEQAQKSPLDPLLYTALPMMTGRGAARALREGLPQNGSIHPLAEAVLGTERVLAHYDSSGEFLAGTFVYRLLSLGDIAVNLDKVRNARERLARLMGDQWRSALYELLVASSQASLGYVELLNETGQSIPDMAIDSVIFLECKAKTQYEGKVADFIGRFKRLALDKIFQETSKIGDGLLIEIDVHDESSIANIPNILRSMFSNRLTRKSTASAKIRITPYQPGPFDLPYPMKAHSAELWRWLMNFDGWRDWHLVQPYGEFIIDNASSVMTKSVRRPILICVKSTALLKTTQNVRTTIASACRLQLKNYQPGVARVLVNSELYGIGPNSNAETIKENLDALALNLLSQYSRLAAVRFDIVTPPNRGELQGHYASAGAVRPIEGHNLEAIAGAPGVFLM